ncbi:mannitol dehydrogenase family protein [Treponema parvum]|uniref:mannitol dehydrogenase family protein n=1 Tax=Treponema parvum TaxID=138851 RepID=UPI001AEC3C23|nr:mannitol dehydrogenase family protein [Treponema parvum]QTQ15436.1 mannitol dehydrogenase family protein [Treponema parvum]
MTLSKESIKDRSSWEAKKYFVPAFDHEKMVSATKKAPVWVHFGAGNIFRGFSAVLMQTLLDKGETEKGIIVGEGFDYDIIDKIYTPYDNISLLVTLNADGSISKKIVASIAEAWKCDSSFKKEWDSFKEVFANTSLQMVTFTITEKGYALGQGNNFFPFVAADFEAGPEGKLNSMMSKITSLVYHRFKTCKAPVALVSTDNCSHNGEKLQNAVLAVAKKWVEKKFCEKEFISYLEKNVSFPWSMIDKITPRPDASVKAMLEKDGFDDTEVVVTGKNTYIAPFVNAEKPEYLVIEDNFPNGRPPLEKAGVYFTDRDTVNKVEKMKVCTCLNPLHTCLAVYGCLLGYTLIADEMKDPVLNKMVNIIGYKEGMPVVVNPKILDPKKFIKEVLEERIPNPFMPDTPQRIATDTSQKLSIRFGETIKAYLADKKLNVKDLKLIPLVFAGWLRYLLAVDDEGKPFTPSSDPRLESSQKYLEGIKLSSKGPFDKALKPLLSDETLFGVDLYKAGLADTVTGYFAELVAGPGAVRKTLEKYVK